jgi:hypothetical protein
MVEKLPNRLRLPWAPVQIVYRRFYRSDFVCQLFFGQPETACRAVLHGFSQPVAKSFKLGKVPEWVDLELFHNYSGLIWRCVRTGEPI